MITQTLLKNPWKIWIIYFTKETEKLNYHIEEYGEFSTVEDFASVFKSIDSPRELKKKEASSISVAIFKDNIHPAWEDEANKKGGNYNWSISVKEDANSSSDAIHDIWRRMAMSVVGGLLETEVFGGKDIINGLILSHKFENTYGISVWVNELIDKSSEMLNFITQTVLPPPNVKISLKSFGPHNYK